MMIKEICLIAIVALGLILVIPGTNVEARDSPQQNSLGSNQHRDSPAQNPIGSHLQSTILPNHGAAIASNPTNIAKIITAGSYLASLGFGAAAIVKFKAHKDNPQQIHMNLPIPITITRMAISF